MKLFPAPTKLPFTAASYQVIVPAGFAVACKVSVPDPQPLSATGLITVGNGLIVTTTGFISLHPPGATLLI